MLKKGAIVTAILILCLFITLFWLMPSPPTYLSFGLGVGTAFLLTLYFVFAIARERRRIKPLAFWIPVVSLSLLSLILPIVFAAVLYLLEMFSIITWILLIALTLTFFFNFLTIPLALYHKQQEAKDYSFLLERYPAITILIPAYNERKSWGEV